MANRDECDNNDNNGKRGQIVIIMTIMSNRGGCDNNYNNVKQRRKRKNIADMLRSTVKSVKQTKKGLIQRHGQIDPAIDNKRTKEIQRRAYAEPEIKKYNRNNTNDILISALKATNYKETNQSHIQTDPGIENIQKEAKPKTCPGRPHEIDEIQRTGSQRHAHVVLEIKYNTKGRKSKACAGRF